MKYFIFTLMLLVACSNLGNIEDHVPASVSEYEIDTIANEALLTKLCPKSNTSDCGLADEDFKKYVRNRVNYSRKFQFIVFVEGTTMTGKRCLRRAFIYYLKEK